MDKMITVFKLPADGSLKAIPEGELTDIRIAWGLYLIGVSHNLRVAKEEGKI